MRFNADFFRIAFACASTEQTRFYLGGVFVEPSESSGAILTATDGHRLICIHDEKAEFGANEAPAIVRLTPEALKLCKTKRDEHARQIVVTVDAMGKGAATIESVVGEGEDAIRTAEGISPGNCLIDGTFPDWRRVLPIETDAFAPTAFDARYLGTLGDLGTELKKLANPVNKQGAATTIRGKDAGAAYWVHWAGIDHAFGILTPVGGAAAITPKATKPTWADRRKPRLQAVA